MINQKNIVQTEQKVASDYELNTIFGPHQSDFADLTGILGFVITIIGFLVTIHNIRKTRNASEQAQEMVVQLRAQLQAFDLVSEFSTSLAALEEIKRFHRQYEMWSLLPDRYTAVKKSLNAIRTSTKQLDISDINEIEETINLLQTFEAKVDGFLLKKTTQPDGMKMNVALSKKLDKFHTIVARIKNNIGGVNG